jgi:hypothetical protein
MTALAAAVCSITSTKRRRFFWAAWWTATPERHPFRKPDAASGGAESPEAALREAEKAAGRRLTVIDPKWARAFNRILREEPPWTPRDFPPEGEVATKASRPASPESPWTILGVAPKATVAEIKQAYRVKALATHPDRGGDAAAFRAVQRAYEKAMERSEKAGKGKKRG